MQFFAHTRALAPLLLACRWFACAASAQDLPSGPVSAPESKAPSVPVPRAFPASRYNSLLEKSPFAVSSAAPEPVAPVENFATNWVVTGISKQRGKDGDESYTVFVRSRDLATRLVISGARPTDDGVSLVSVEEAPVAAKSVVVLRKGSETGRVEFDQAAVAASAAPNPTGQPGAKPGVPAVRNSAGRTPIPRPGMANGVPRPGASLGNGAPANGANAATGAGGPTGGAPGAQEARRRVRPIQEPPGTPPQ